MSGRRLATGFLVLAMMAFVSTAARANEIVKPGDKVQIGFTCRLSNGEIAATTNREIQADPKAKKASVFVARRGDHPLVITAGRDEKIYGKRGHRGFEGEIVAEAAQAVVGMKPGDRKGLVIRREPQSHAEEPMVLDMARVRIRPKEVEMTPGEYKSRTGKDPEVGQDYTIDPAFPGRVVDVSGRQVVMRFQAEPGKKVKTPLGEGEIRENGKNYEIVIDAKRGDLVRSAGMVGRIVNVDERVITIDYSHPFGYEELKCEVKVESLEQRAESGRKLQSQNRRSDPQRSESQ